MITPPFSPPTHLAAVAISAELAQLQQLAETLGDAERTVLRRHLNAISSLCADVQLSVIRTVFALATVDEGMEGFLDLLQRAGADEKPVLAQQLADLLAPLHRQLQFASSEASHLLYDLIDDTYAAPFRSSEGLD